jgi:hypothetical protein
MTSTNIYKPITPTYLYIKQHSVTGLKYFGKTTKKDPYTYLGSGKYWKSHYKKHGKIHIITLWVSDLYYDTSIVEHALQFSSENNIVESDKWANLVPENGLSGGSLGTILSDEHKSKISASQKGKPKSDSAKRASALGRVGSKQPNSSINRSLTWIITDPYGIIYTTHHLKTFCIDYNLKYHSVIGITIKGTISKRGSISGWKFIQKN